MSPFMGLLEPSPAQKVVFPSSSFPSLKNSVRSALLLTNLRRQIPVRR